MLVLGHTGTALAAGLLLGRLPVKRSWLAWPGRLDLRFVLLGSLLPDIIDKPLGEYLFRETFGSGRIFAHTLLFLAVLATAGLVFYRRRRQTWLLALSFGTLTHVLADQMWRNLPALFWPLLGAGFPRMEAGDFVAGIIHNLLTNPAVYVPEILGGLLTGWFLWGLLRHRRVLAFLRYGRAAPDDSRGY